MLAQPNLLALNRSCGCLPLDTEQIRADILSSWPALPLDELLEERGALFAGSGVFVSPHDLEQMRAVIDAVEAAAQLPAYLAALAARDSHVVTDPGGSTRGLFMGYDFHLSDQGPQLIEINTNAGGAGLVNALQQTQVMSDPQCAGARLLTFVPDAAVAIAASVRAEWLRSGRSGEPTNIAIVDGDPSSEYLYPDMLLLQALLAEQGLPSTLIPAAQLVWSGQRLSARGQQVDMVYNRLTDFELEHDGNIALRDAWLAGAAVVSPSPAHHRRFADKRNLAILSEPNHPALQGLAVEHRRALAQVPRTHLLSASSADHLWSQRKNLFFKPIAGFAGRGAYRGNKLTKKTWVAMQKQPYVAQVLVPPAQRLLRSPRATTPDALLKFDVRLYTYAGEPLLLAARAYQGQTTNFRTPGGGFAPVFGCQQD